MNRRILNLLLVFVLIVLSGCTADQGSEDPVPTDDGNVPPVTEIGDDPDDENKQPDNKVSSPFSIEVNNHVIGLCAWDHEVDLDLILGEPLDEEIRQLGSGADTFAGCYLKELTYEGLFLQLMSAKDDDSAFWIVEIVITDDQYVTVGGVRIGDDVDMVMEMYPQAAIRLDGRTDPDNCAYEYRCPDSYYSMFIFEVADGVVTTITAYYEIP